MCKYSHGELPHGLEPVLRRSGPADCALWHPGVLYLPLEAAPGEVGPPVWCYSAQQRAKVMQEYTDNWRGRPNYESIQMPLYYTLVGPGMTWERCSAWRAETFSIGPGSSTFPFISGSFGWPMSLARNCSRLQVRLSWGPLRAGFLSPGCFLRTEQRHPVGSDGHARAVSAAAHVSDARRLGPGWRDVPACRRRRPC